MPTRVGRGLRMPNRFRILIFGASYGSLFATKCVAAGHVVDLVCLSAEAEAINHNGAVVRMPIKGGDRLVELNSKALPGTLAAGTTEAFNPVEYDLVVLAMQEPQYCAPDVRKLLNVVARARVPCLSIMNMPPLPCLYRIPTIGVAAARNCYTDASVWDGFDPSCVTLCSPDAQAVRPLGSPANVLQVGLATNFKAARFESNAHTDVLWQLERDIDAVRFETVDGLIDLPVKLRVYDSPFVPLAKWSMLLAGNYRCVQADGFRSIRDAVHTDLDLSRSVYEWVAAVCLTLGANERDMVPFAKYAKAALDLQSPSSAARALGNGACHIERVDRLVQTIAHQLSMHSEVVADTVALVDHWLARNRESSV